MTILRRLNEVRMRPTFSIAKLGLLVMIVYKSCIEMHIFVLLILNHVLLMNVTSWVSFWDLRLDKISNFLSEHQILQKMLILSPIID